MRAVALKPGVEFNGFHWSLLVCAVSMMPGLRDRAIRLSNAPRGPRRITLAVGGHAKRAQEFAHLLKRGEFVVAALDDGTTRALDVDALDDQLSEDDASGPRAVNQRLPCLRRAVPSHRRDALHGIRMQFYVPVSQRHVRSRDRHHDQLTSSGADSRFGAHLPRSSVTRMLRKYGSP